MAEVYGQIKANYYQDKSDADLFEGAMKGMVSDLDPHSEYMDKKGYADMKESTSGEFGGLGMEIGQEDGFIKVIAPIEDTPAERAGVKSGDFIAKIDNVSTRGLTTSEAVKKMRGKPGTKITLTLSRKNVDKPIVVNLTRAIIKVKSVRHHLLEPNYGYIRVSQFQERTVAGINEAAKALIKANKGAPLKGIILDLRDDPGGLLDGAVGVSAAFLPADAKVVSTKGRDGKEGMVLKARPEDYIRTSGRDPLADLPAELKTIPMTVLINSGSASASEIVAGALQDHKRAVVVGTQSFGKGNPLGGEDVNSSNEISTPDSNEAAKADENAKSKKGKDKEKDEDLSSRRIPNPAKDDQLRKALDLVKNPAEWQKSLGLAAKKPAPKKDKKDGKDESK